VLKIADENLEERLNASPQAESGVEKKVTKEKKKGFFRKAFDFTYLTGAAIGATLVSSAFLGPLGFIVGGAFGGGGLVGTMIKGDKTVYDSVTDFLKTYASVNAVLAPMVWLGNATYPIVGKVGSKIAGGIGAMVAKTTYAVTAYNAMFVAHFKAAYHLVDNYMNPKGITKTVKENYSALTKRIGAFLSVPYALSANGINSIMGMPVFAPAGVAFGLYNSMNPIGGKK